MTVTAIIVFHSEGSNEVEERHLWLFCVENYYRDGLDKFVFAGQLKTVVRQNSEI